MKLYANDEDLLLEVAIWENEDEGEGDEGGADESSADSKTGGNKDRVFTQAEVDRMIVKRNKSVQSQLQQMEQNYEKLLQDTRLNEEQRGEYESDLENLRKQMRTKEQQLEHEKKQSERKYSEQVQSLQKETEHYKTLYETSTISRSLVDAASSGDAYEPSQIVELLQRRTKLVEELDADGNKTGQKVPMVEWEVESDGKSEIVLKKPKEVVEAMKENKRYQNLFKSNVVAGLGSGNAGPGTKGGRVDVTSMTPQEYASFRKTPEGRTALGLTR